MSYKKYLGHEENQSTDKIYKAIANEYEERLQLYNAIDLDMILSKRTYSNRSRKQGTADYGWRSKNPGRAAGHPGAWEAQLAGA